MILWGEENMSEEYTYCDYCDSTCKESELLVNHNGYCNDCQRWHNCLHADESPCFYYSDPCHYICKECRDGKNFKLDITESKEWKLKLIKQFEEKIKILKDELNNDV